MHELITIQLIYKPNNFLTVSVLAFLLISKSIVILDNSVVGSLYFYIMYPGSFVVCLCGTGGLSEKLVFYLVVEPE